jgi:cytochrome c2
MKKASRAHPAIPRAQIVMFASVLCVLVACSRERKPTPDHFIANGDATRGSETIQAYGCGSCHSIPGIRGADGMVGPPLDHWAERKIIAGEVPNDPARLITWLTVPQSIEPGTAMPNMGVTDGQARDIASYLYTLH